MSTIPSREVFARFLAEVGDEAERIAATTDPFERAVRRGKLSGMLEILKRFKAWPIEIVGHEPPNGWIGKDEELLECLGDVVEASDKGDLDGIEKASDEARQRVLEEAPPFRPYIRFKGTRRHGRRIRSRL